MFHVVQTPTINKDRLCLWLYRLRVERLRASRLRETLRRERREISLAEEPVQRVPRDEHHQTGEWNAYSP